MYLPDFAVEQWMNQYENDAKYNLTDTCATALSFNELMDMAADHMKNVVLDYGAITGDEKLKQEILALYQTGSIENITTCHGCLEANQMVMDVLLEPGDHVLAFTPGYQQFYDYPRSLGCSVDTIALDESRGWCCEVSDVTSLIQPHTKMIILNNPNNPTGTYFSMDWIQSLIAACKEKDIYILCDEVYRDFNQDYAISDLYEKGISTGSLSKVFAVAGLRFGWIKANQDIIDRINLRRDYTIISTGPMIDALAYTVLQNKEMLLERNHKQVQANKEIVTKWLESDDRFELVMPQKGTVGFLKYNVDIPSEELARTLLKETGVFFVPGACFGCEYHLRLGFGQSSAQMKMGLSLLSQWMQARQSCE